MIKIFAFLLVISGIGFVYSDYEIIFFFCNPLLKLSLHSFWLFGDWPIRLRSGQGLIGFELGLFLYPASGIKFL